MYGSLVGHLVRRGVHTGVKCGGMKGVKESISAPGWTSESHGIHGHDNKMHHGHHGHHGLGSGNPMEELLEKLKSPGAIITVVSTIAILLFIDFMINYTLGNLAINMAIAEDPEPTGAIRLPLNDTESDPSIAKAPLLKDGGNGTVIIEEFRPSKPITSSLRGTVRHIRSISGFRSYFRGLPFAMFYKLIFFCFFGVFSGMLRSGLGRVIAVIMTAALTCNLHAAWTHATIAAPSEYTRRGFFARFLHRGTAKHLILPTIRYLLTVNLTGMALARAVHICHSTATSRDEKKLTAILALVAALIIAVVGAFAAIIPAHIALIRVELSHMPEDAPAIVPFDKTFGGRINVQEQTTGTWKSYLYYNLSMRGAYATFDRATYKHVLKMLVKIMAVQTLVFIVAFLAIFTEVYFLVGKEAKAVAISMRHGN